MMMREQQWDRSNCRHFRIDVCLHQRIYMRAFVNARNKIIYAKNMLSTNLIQNYCQERVICKEELHAKIDNTWNKEKRIP